VNLNLLGLRVKLDNCNNGPITLAVTATSGPGNLLGNLLSGLSNLLNGTTRGTVQAVQSNLSQVVSAIGSAGPLSV